MKFTNEFTERIERTLTIWREVGLTPTRMELHVDTMREHFGGCWGATPDGHVFVPTDDGDVAFMRFQGLRVYLNYDRESELSYDTRLKENFRDRKEDHVQNRAVSRGSTAPLDKDSQGSRAQR